MSQLGTMPQLLPIVLACLWLIAANLLAMLPSPDNHRTCALVLIVIGVPLLGWVTLSMGPVAGLLLLAAGASILRWPLLSLSRWLRQKVR